MSAAVAPTSPEPARRRETTNAVPLVSETSLDDYVIVRPCGEGSFGKVFQARRRFTGRACAMKFIPKHGKSERDLASLRQEIDIMRTLDHPNVIKMLDAFETAMDFVVVMEFAQGVLNDVLERDATLPESEVRRIAEQLISALHYLHSNRVIHRDLKPQNILIGSDGCVKVCDFGFARSMSKSSLVMTSIKGTPLYMAPELVQEQPYDHSVDLWSIGVILYELFVGKPPFYTNSMYALLNRIAKEDVKYPDTMSNTFKSFLQGLLIKKPRERLNWPNVLDHPFVRGFAASEGPQDIGPLGEERAEGTPMRRRRDEGQAGASHSGRSNGVAATTASSLEDVSDVLRQIENTARQSEDAACGLRHDREALTKILETLQPQTSFRSKFLPSYISNRTLASKKSEAKPMKTADVASALRSTLAMLCVPRAKLASAGGGASAMSKELPAAVIAACTTAANASDPPQPELLALAVKVVATMSDPAGSSPWCGLGLCGYLMFLGKLLGYPHRDVGEVVASTASAAIANAVQAAIERGQSTELSATRAALGPQSSKGGGVTDALCQALAKSLTQATASETCRALYATTEIGTLTAYLAATLSLKKDGTQKLIRSATTKVYSAKLLKIVAEASEDVRSQAMEADGVRILAAILVDETSKRTVTSQNARLASAIMQAVEPLLSSRTQHPVVTVLDVGLAEALCSALTVFLPVAKKVKGDIVHDVALAPAATLLRVAITSMRTAEMDEQAIERSMRQYRAILHERGIVKTLLERIKTSPMELWSAPIALLSSLIMSSGTFATVFAKEFITYGGLDPTLCEKVLDGRANAQIVIDWLIIIMQLARMDKDNYILIDEADVIRSLTKLLDHPNPNVRARACNTIGNVCRHNDYFYEEFKELKTLEKLIERCGDRDRTTRKFATFAIGNAAFHSAALYGPLTAAVDPLMQLLDASEEDKTRSNACAALGNMARNSSDLCELMVSSGAVDAIINLIAVPAEATDPAFEAEIIRVCFYSLGNLCRFRVCRERVASRNIDPILDDLARRGDDAIKGYVTRIKTKLAAAASVRASQSR